MRCHCEEPRLGAVGGVGKVAGLGKPAFGLGAVGDVAADALHLRRPAGIDTDQALVPCDPSRPDRGRDFLVVNPRTVLFQRRIALLKNIEREIAADQRSARQLRQFAIGVVDESDTTSGIAQDDQVVLRFEQAAGALLGFLQFPVAVGQRFVMQSDLAQLPAHPAQPHAQGRKRNTSHREQEAGADREGMGVIAGIFGSAAGNESIRTAKGGGEDHERADGGSEPGMTSREATHAHLDPETPPHSQLS